MKRTAVLFDLGGVVLGSPLQAIRVYTLRLGVAPDEVIFLDDIGGNLKPARARGMATIKVEQPRAALEQLSRLVGLDLL